VWVRLQSNVSHASLKPDPQESGTTNEKPALRRVFLQTSSEPVYQAGCMA
jgi:hypothetical protein